MFVNFVHNLPKVGMFPYCLKKAAKQRCMLLHEQHQAEIRLNDNNFRYQKEFKEKCK